MLTRTQVLSYAIAQIGSSTFIFVPALLLMPFMTSVLGIGAALAGLVIFVPKLWVVVCDPLMGSWSDRVRSRSGRRRPFLLWGGMATALSIVLIFVPPRLGSEWQLGGYMMMAYLLGSTAYSALVVPYISMASEMASDAQGRIRVTAWRVAFGYAGSLVGMSAPMLAQLFGSGRPGYSRMAVILGMLCLASTTIAFWGTRHVPAVVQSSPAAPIAKQLRAVLSNREFAILLRSYFIQLLAVGGAGVNFAYYIVYQLGGELSQFAYFGLAITLGGLIAQPLWVRFAARVGKLRAYRVSVTALLLVETLYLLPGRGDFVLAYAITVFVGAFAASYPIMAYSMLADTIVRDAAKSGLHREGAFSGVWTAGEKVALAAGAMLVGLLLRAVGFQSSTTGFGAQSDLAHLGVRLVNGVATPVLLALSLWSLSQYRARSQKDSISQDGGRAASISGEGAPAAVIQHSD